MISVVIPAYNEATQIVATIQQIRKGDRRGLVKEIIVADGGSTDATATIAGANGAIVKTSPDKGRAAQLNYGASFAGQEFLFFLHADSVPPECFTDLIADAVTSGYMAGCFRLAFDYDHWFLKANCWFTRFDVNAIRFGDQGLFVSKEIFINCGQYNKSLLMMEDQEIIHRIKKNARFKVMNGYVITSARKYIDNGIYRMQAIFFRIWLQYYMGFSQAYLLRLHKRLIKKHKL